MSEPDPILCRDCEEPIGLNIIDTEKPCYHILITGFTKHKHLGCQEDSFMLCKSCFPENLKHLYHKEMPKRGICKKCQKNTFVKSDNICKKCRNKNGEKKENG